MITFLEPFLTNAGIYDPTYDSMIVYNGLTYEFKKTTGWEEYVSLDKYSDTIFQVIVYDRDENQAKTDIELASGESVDVYLPSEFKEYWTIFDKELFKKLEITPGEEYEFVNEFNGTSLEIRFEKFAYDDLGYKFTKETLDGVVISSGSNSKSDLVIEEKSKIKFELQGDKNKILYVPRVYGYCLKKLNTEPEDVSKDGVIDIYDLTMVASRYNMASDNPLYIAERDLNNDGIIDLYDLVIVAKRI